MKVRLVLALSLIAATTASVAADRRYVRQVGDVTLRLLETPHPLPSAVEGSEIWQDVIHHEDATYIAVHFSKFELGPGEKVVISTPDGRYAHAFEGLGKPRTGGTFWATHVPGDTCLVTYYAGGDKPGFGYTIDRYAHGYPAPWNSGLSPEAPEAVCGADNTQEAKCYQVSEPTIYTRSRAVVRLLISGQGLCTAWLVGNEGHVMTNNHCILNQSDADNVDYELMAEGATCATNCQTDGGCPGTIVASSGTLVKTNVPMDYSLVLLPTNVSATYGFLKLRTGPPVINERIYVPGHPSGFGKRIAVTSDNPNDQSGFTEISTLNFTPCVTDGPLDVTYFADTQGGSSGSPVIAYSDHKVVSIHHCNAGGGACPNRGVPINQIISDLQATGDLPNGAIEQFAGTVTLDSNSYGCSDTIGITVLDDSLVGNPTQAVTIVSSTEVTPETVTLTALPAPNNNTFTGSIPTTTSGPVAGNGQLTVTNGGTITVTYIDANDGAGGTNIPRNDAAGVDCVVPIISNISASSITGQGAVINWTTNEPATSSVQYGLSTPPGSSASSAALVTSHALPIGPLQECSAYFYSVASQDEAGNGASNNNGGSYFSFATIRNTSPNYTSTDTPIPIPDNTPAGATSTINVGDNEPVLDVNVRVNLTHSYDGDLVLSLIGPNNTTVTLANLRGGAGQNYVNTVFDDQAATPIGSGTPPFTGSFIPDTSLNVLNGINAAGAWRLKVVDAAAQDIGTIDNWTLSLTYPPGACGAGVAYMSNTRTDSCSVGGAGNGNGVIDRGEDVVIPVTLRNNGTVPISGISATLSTSTPGVVVTRATATYPNLAVGVSASSAAPHLAFSVGSSVPCGTNIQFALSIATNQGTFNDAFTVRVGSPTTATNTHNSTDTPKAIPDSVTTTSAIAVANTNAVTDVNARIALTHTYDADLDIFLVAPTGARIELSTDNGGSLDNYTNTIFDQQAATAITSGAAPFTGSFRPEGNLSVLNGIPANGNWTLEVTDDAPGDTGTLSNWSVILGTEAGFACSDCALAAPTGSPLLQSWVGKNGQQWEAIPNASWYNVYRGVPSGLPALLTGAADSCLRATVGSTSTGPMLGESPAAGGLFWYIVRAANAGGQGPAGNATAGPRNQSSTGPCP